MEIKVLLKQNLMPKFYRNYALSFVKNCLKEGDKNIYTEFYGTEKVLRKKPFSFDIYFKGSKVGDMYFIEKQPILKFSTTSPGILSAFLKGLSMLSTKGHQFGLSEHLLDKAYPKLLGVDKKLISNILSFKNFLLPESAKRWRENTEGMSLEEKVRFYFANQGLQIEEIYHLKEKKFVKHKFRNVILTVKPLELTVRVRAENKEKLMEITYNGLGWFSSEGFGYTNPVRKVEKQKVLQVK